MGYIDGNLVDGEQVVFRTKLHAAVLMFPILITGLAVAYLLPTRIGLFVIALPACWLAVELANHGISEFGVTNKRVLMKRGYLPRKIMESPLAQVEGIQVTQSALGKKIGYGTVVVRGTDGSSTSFSSLNLPVAFRERVQEQLGRIAPAGTRPAK
jgi:uncharacterized membrane protein YdbT with pleckstrin-like domain